MKHSFRHWLAEDGLSYLQDAITMPTRALYSMKYYINNRWITKTHQLTSKLKPGKWHEFNTRMLHCMFDELVNFVEVEKAGSYVAWDSDARQKYKAPFYSFGWFKWRTWRSPAAGIAYLEWETTVNNNDWSTGEDDPNYNVPSQQAVSAQEILDLYKWWTTVYPARPDPMVASGWAGYCDQTRYTSIFAKKSSEEYIESQKLLTHLAEIEESYNKEDTEMLIRLVKIRDSMWT